MGAPPELIAGAHQAALDEVDHARRTFALASAYAGRALAPAPLAELLDARPGAGDAVSRLAVESLVDGCLNEGFSAAVAAAAGERATDLAVRATLEVIARDEAAHCELAWDIVGWCVVTSASAREAVAAELGRLPRLVSFSGLSAAEQHGRLDGATQRELFAQVRRELVERGHALVTPTPPVRADLS